MTNRYTSLENAVRILKSFSDRQPEYGVSELSEKLQLGVSTTHRLLTSLAEEGFVVKNKETNKYTLGLSILQLTNTVTEQMHIIRESFPILQQLTNKTGESSQINIIDSTEVFCLQKVESPHDHSLEFHLGKRAPVHCTSAGQTILAYQSEQEIQQFLSPPLESFTRFTLTEPNQIKAKLAQIKKDGYAVSNQEYEDNVFTVSAPVYNKNNTVVASITIVGPAQRMKPRKKLLIENTITAVQTLSSIIKKRQSASFK
ncbi:IclR family transcriptional regulator [Bacillus sp. FJAT-44742]|uniref:IclR family transcriptional regulator n=1 Tax=Bacillus sp. FJAT-44742 TaxID=2014005 RepID=UPI000C2397FF|nr:IclR family transcriptional regulator [Bacillus sp. FJAT-44742]